MNLSRHPRTSGCCARFPAEGIRLGSREGWNRGAESQRLPRDHRTWRSGLLCPIWILRQSHAQSDRSISRASVYGPRTFCGSVDRTYRLSYLPAALWPRRLGPGASSSAYHAACPDVRSEIGASRPLRRVAAMVRFLITKRAVSRRSRNWSSCPPSGPCPDALPKSARVEMRHSLLARSVRPIHSKRPLTT